MTVLHGVAWGLLILGGVAGIALFFRSATSYGSEASWGVFSLWGMFLVCTGFGIYMVLKLNGEAWNRTRGVDHIAMIS